MDLQLKVKTPRTFQQRFLLTIILLTLVRIGSFIPLHYIDTKTFSPALNTNNSTTTIVGILNTFSGGEASSVSILSLGIIPNINASIILQLVTQISPALLKLQKEEGEYGRRKLTDYTRYLTFFCALIESVVTTYSFRPLIFNWNFLVIIQISLSLITGSMILLWFSELITKDGLGNGSSILICFNIVSNFPDQLKVIALNLANNNSLGIFLVGGFLLTTVGCVYINEAMVRIPLISARQLLRQPNERSLWENSILPLRVNQVGVMPLVFTSSVMVILSSVTNFIYQYLINSKILSGFNTLAIGKVAPIFYWITYSLLVFFFTSFYSNIILDPKDIADQFRKNSVSIRGINPGISTQRYLRQTIKTLDYLNSSFLIVILFLLNLLEYLLPLNNLNLRGFGLTSQLILVNVLIYTFKKIQSFLNAEKKM